MFKNQISQFAQQNLRLFWVFFILLLSHFLLSVTFYEFESGVYLKYLISIIQDQDFNIFNQFSDSMNKWMVTTQYNHPDYHSPFLSTFLLIPYLLSRLVASPTANFTAYFLAYLLALGLIMAQRTPAHKHLKTGLLISFLCSIGVVYLIFEPGEPSLLCLPFSFLILSDLSCLEEKKPIKVQTLISLYLFVIFKPDSFLWVIPVTIIAYYFSSIKEAIKCLFAVTLGLTQIKLVDFIRFGFDFTANPVLQLENNYLFEHLFGPVGLFHLQPIFLVGIIGLVWGALSSANKKERILCLFSLSILLSKIGLISFMISPIIDTQAGRNFLTELPLVGLGLVFLYRASPRLCSLSVLLSFIVNIYHIEIYLGAWLDIFDINNIDYISNRAFFSFKSFGKGLQTIYRFYEYRFEQYDLLNLALVLAKSILFSVIIVPIVYLLQSPKYKKNFLMGLAFTSILFAALNLINNQRNVQYAMKDNDYHNVVVASKHARYYDEVMYLIIMLEENSEVISEKAEINIRNYKNDFLLKVIQGVHKDPIGLVDELRSGVIRKSFWNLVE